MEIFQVRNIIVRYIKDHPVENNDWGDFQTHRRLLGLISLGKYDSQAELNELCRVHESFKVKYTNTLFDSRCVLFGSNGTEPKSYYDPRSGGDMINNLSPGSQTDTSSVDVSSTDSSPLESSPRVTSKENKLGNDESAALESEKQDAQKVHKEDIYKKNIEEESFQKGNISKENIHEENIRNENIHKEMTNKDNIHKDNIHKENIHKDNIHKENFHKDNIQKEDQSNQDKPNQENLKEGNTKQELSSQSSIQGSTINKNDTINILKENEQIKDNPTNENLDNAVKDQPKQELFTTPPNFKTRALFYNENDPCLDLESQLYEFINSLFWVLESKRLERSREKLERVSLLYAPFEKKDFVGLDMESRNNRKRCTGRMTKHLGDLCLQAGLLTDSLNYYNSAAETLKSVNDWLWLGAAYEGLCAASALVLYPNMNRNVSLHRNASLQEGSPKRSNSITLSPNDLVVRKDVTNHLQPEDISKRYREAIIHYSKYQNAGK